MEPIRASEINEIIRKQIENFDSDGTVTEVGTVIKIGDGIAEIHGLEKVMAGELLESARIDPSTTGAHLAQRIYKLGVRPTGCRNLKCGLKKCLCPPTISVIVVYSISIWERRCLAFEV